ncbi:tyrosine-type recombinase/integrase [Salinibacter sp.]|uniref:tyrosine-type recombinase/integrase n=1 Tax=Salinibacter sp. TaxID=2065818 RepID=UPI0021E8E891|nr:site-specific integrase [Salinibacter sp.]
MARLRKISGNYYGYFQDRSREPKEKSWPLRVSEQRAARRKLSDLEEGYEKGDFDPWAGGWQRERVTLTEGIERFLDAKEGAVRDQTLEGYETKLKAWARDHCPNDIQLHDVAPRHVSPHVHASDVSPATRQTRFRHLRMLFNWAEEAGLLDDGESPIDDVSKPRGGDTEPEYLDPDQIGKILRAIRAHRKMRDGEPGPQPDDHWLTVMIRLCLCTGLRRGEALPLRWMDVDLDNGMLVVRHREQDDAPTKSGNERRIPLRGDALDALRKEHERRDPDPSAHIIVDSDNQPIREDRVSHRFKFFVRKAKLSGREQIHFHTLRHSCAAWLLQQGVPLAVVSEILGHSSIQITDQIYAHVSDDAVTEAMDDVFGGVDEG